MRKLKLFFACLLMAVLSIGQMWAGEVTISPSQALNDGGVSPISIVCAKGDGTSNPAISSGELRLYQAGSGKTTGNTITFSSTYPITKIVFDFTSGKTASNGSFSDGSYDDATMTWTGSATSLTLTVTGTTSGTRIYIKGMTVTYDAGSVTPDPDPTPGEDPEPTDDADVVLDFSQNWGLPTSSGTKKVAEESFTDGTHTIKVAGTTGNGYYISSSTYLLLGKNGAYVILPEFSSPIEKIVCEAGASSASTGVKWNVFDGNTAVSTEVTGCTTDNTFEIENPTANKAYKIKVGSNHNLQIAKIKIYFEPASSKEAAGLAFETAAYLVKANGSLATPTLSTADGFDGTVTYASSDADVVAVNTTTGALTIKAAGKAEITASSLETENFKAGSAKYTIYVAEQAGTAEEPLTEASAKALIDLGCTLDVYVTGTILTPQYYDQSKTYTVTLTDGFQFYYFYAGPNEEQFDADILTAGDVLVAYGNLKKSSNNYRLNPCYMVARVPYTAPKTSIANTKETAYTVAQALAYAADPVTYDITESVYIAGVVYDVKSFNSNNGTYDIYIKDAGAENKFEFRTCTGLYDADLDAVVPFDEGDVQIGDEVIGYGVMYYYNQGSIWQFNQGGNYLVSLNRPEVAVTGIELTESTAEVEVGSTVTLHASVLPENASNKGITWSVQSGNDKAEVDANGVVTGTAAGEAVIRAASTADPTKYAECTVTVTAVDPTVHHVTFIAGTDKSDETSITKDGITISATTFNNDSYYQCYANSAMTVSSAVGNITKIELTCTASGTAKYGPGNWDFTGYSYDGTNGSWAGSAETVEFGTASQQVRMTLITVTYKEDSRAEAGLAWNPADDIEITVGDAFSAPALLNPNSIDAAEITIESNNESLATVTAGVVALVADATGEATITATFAGNDDYKPATVSYNITVNAAAPTPLTDYYEKVTSGAVAEGTYLIVYEAGNVAFNGGLETLDASSNTIEVEITNDNKIGVTQATAAATFYIDPTAGTIQAANGKYIGVTSNSNGLKTSDNADAYSHNFSIDGDGNAVIAAAFDQSTMTLRYNSDSNQKRFRYYKTTSYPAIQLYKLANEVIKPEAGLAWDPAEDITLTVGDAFTAPTLTNPNNIDAAEITIASSNTNVATINNGEVELVADATGTTTITATFAGNDDFKPATVSYKIKVNPAHSIYVSPSLNVNFGSVAKNASVDDKVITVTLTGVDAATATLEGAGASAFEFTPAALTASGDITISASSATAGTFAATLTISDDAGEATSRVVNLSLTVTDPAAEETPISTTSKWVAATAADLVDGAEVIITGVKDEVVYAMGEQKSTNRAAYVATVDGEGVLTPGEGTMSFTLVAQETEGVFALRTSDGKYLYAAASGSNHLKTQDEVDVNAQWTLSVTSAVATGSSNRNVMQFNGSGTNKLFSCYASANQSAIQFYVEKQETPEPPTPATPDYTRDVTNGHYGTICLPKAGTIEGATLYEIGSFESNMIYIDEVGTTLTAGVPYIFYASEAQLNVYYTDKTADDVPAGDANGLYGFYNLSDEDATFDIPVDAGNYILYNDQYWLVSGRAAYIANYRAYIKLGSIVPKSAAPGRRRVAMAVNGEQVVTGIDALNAAEAPVKVLINGQMYILRGEKMYNVNGQVVK